MRVPCPAGKEEAVKRTLAALARISGLALVLSWGAGGAPVRAQEEVLAFSMEATEACLADGAHPGTPAQCIGESARLCMERSDYGQTTVGITACLGHELEAWDRRLNAAYRALMAQERAADAELADLGSAAPRAAVALREMQRAWIAWRDARCAYVAARWGGGTGAGPAAQECFMEETGRQALFLKRMLEGY